MVEFQSEKLSISKDLVKPIRQKRVEYQIVRRKAKKGKEKLSEGKEEKKLGGSNTS